MKLDIRNIVIVVLIVLLSSLLIFGNKIINDESNHRIKLMHEVNKALVAYNDSLSLIIVSQDKEMEKIKTLLEDNNKELKKSKTEINRLKNEKNKIYPTTKRMSANNVAITFSKYLDKRTEGKDICK